MLFIWVVSVPYVLKLIWSWHNMFLVVWSSKPAISNARTYTQWHWVIVVPTFFYYNMHILKNGEGIYCWCISIVMVPLYVSMLYRWVLRLAHTSASTPVFLLYSLNVQALHTVFLQFCCTCTDLKYRRLNGFWATNQTMCSISAYRRRLPVSFLFMVTLRLLYSIGQSVTSLHTECRYFCTAHVHV